MDIIETSIDTIAFISQCTIGILAVLRMAREHKLKMCLNLLFLCSLLCACCHSLVSVLQRFFNLGAASSCFGLLSFGGFYFSLLATFILRLHLTFKASALAMSLKLRILFCFILSVFLLSFLVVAALYFAVEYGKWVLILHLVLIPMGLLYIIGCVLAVYFFVSNLSKLAKGRRNTLTKMNVELDPQQQQLSDVAAKYMMLFVIAMGTTILIYALSSSVQLPGELRHSLLEIDLSVNLLCIYLQFAFAKDHYETCCGCCDKRFNGIVSRRMEVVIQKHINIKVKMATRGDTNNSMMSVPSLSPVTSVSTTPECSTPPAPLTPRDNTVSV